MERDINYSSFLHLNVEQYNDKWIALVDGKLVSVKKNFKDAYTEAKQKFPQKRPLLAKIPSKKVMIL